MDFKDFEFYVKKPEELRDLYLKYTVIKGVSIRSCVGVIGFSESTLRHFLDNRRKTSRLTLIKIYNFLKKEMITHR